MDLWSKAFVRNGHIEILPKILKFQNAPSCYLNDISLIYTKFGAFAIISIIVSKVAHVCRKIQCRLTGNLT